MNSVERMMIECFKVGEDQDVNELMKNINLFVDRVTDNDDPYHLTDLIPLVEKEDIYIGPEGEDDIEGYILNNDYEDFYIYALEDKLLSVLKINKDEMDEDFKREWNNNLLSLTIDEGSCFENDICKEVVIDLNKANWIVSKHGYLNGIRNLVCSEENSKVLAHLDFYYGFDDPEGYFKGINSNR